jgi:hypothetical protein
VSCFVSGYLKSGWVDGEHEWTGVQFSRMTLPAPKGLAGGAGSRGLSQ